MKRKILNPAAMLAAGLALGVISRLPDIYTQNPGNVFSQTAIWILMGTHFLRRAAAVRRPGGMQVLISIYSDTPKRAMANVFPFCAGMLATYYVTAAVTHGVYHRSFIIGRSVFALCAPVSVGSTVILFDWLRRYDYVIHAALIYFLFFSAARRTKEGMNCRAQGVRRVVS